MKLCKVGIIKASLHYLFSKSTLNWILSLTTKKRNFSFLNFSTWEILQPTLEICGQLPQYNCISQEFLIMRDFNFIFQQYLCRVTK